ncbi:MAG: thioesterase family protein [Acidimicrobiia bacterium]|nr:thioesterase family protein [Acidimicrobiia bacterium]
MPPTDPTEAETQGALATTGAADLLADTSLSADPAVSGRYHSAIPVAWQIRYAFGGVTMMTALRAAEAELGRPDLRPLTASALFCAPVPCGPVVTDATVLRNGRTAAQVASDLRVPGSDGVALRLQANFASDHGDMYDFTDVGFPDGVADPDAYDPPPPPPEDAPFQVNYHDQTEWRFVTGNRPWDGGFEAGPARALSWHRLLCEPRHDDGRYELSALCVPGDILGSAVGQALGPRAGHFFVLSLEIAIRFVAPPVGPWILQDARADHSSGGYATGTSFLWDTDQRLVAIATQTAYLKPFTE